MSSRPKISQQGVPAVVGRVLHSGRVWTIQGIGTLLWLGLFYAWLWIREAKWWQVAGSVLLALFLLYLAAFLQRTALRVYRRERLIELGQTPAPPRRPGLGEWLPRAMLVALVLGLLVWTGGWIGDLLPEAAQKAGSWLTLHLRRPIDPDRLLRVADSLSFLRPWFLLVVFWLPLAAAALLGEAEFWHAAARAWRRGRYWLATLACVAVGNFSFWKLAGWVPKVHGIPGETVSALIRLVLGFVIALGAWLVILALVEEAIARRPEASPDDTQDMTPHVKAPAGEAATEGG